MKYNINYLMNKVHVCDTDSRELDEGDWEEILSKDSEALADKVDEIYRFYARSPEGWGSLETAFVASSTDGRWITMSAWADTTGWGCQQNDVSWKSFDTLEEAIKFGLSQSDRMKMDLLLKEEEAALFDVARALGLE